MIHCTRIYGGFTIESDRVMTPVEMFDHLKSEKLVPEAARLGTASVHAQHDREGVYWLWHLSWHVGSATTNLKVAGR